jgi:hypothetical protein
VDLQLCREVGLQLSRQVGLRLCRVVGLQHSGSCAYCSAGRWDSSAHRWSILLSRQVGLQLRRRVSLQLSRQVGLQLSRQLCLHFSRQATIITESALTASIGTKMLKVGTFYCKFEVNGWDSNVNRRNFGKFSELAFLLQVPNYIESVIDSNSKFQVTLKPLTYLKIRRFYEQCCTSGAAASTTWAVPSASSPARRSSALPTSDSTPSCIVPATTGTSCLVYLSISTALLCLYENRYT